MRPALRAGGVACLGLLLFGAGVLVADAALGQRRLEVYRAQQRPAEELLPLAQVAMAEEGMAALDAGTNSLVLAGSPAAVARTLELLRDQDRARRSLTLHWTSRTRADLEAEGVRLEWSVSAGDLRVGTARFPDGQGLRLAALASEGAAAGTRAGTLRLLDGDEGQIGTGSLVPVAIGGRFGRETALVEAESGVRARARLLGDGRVQVEIRPMESAVAPDGSVRFHAAASSITVRPGETVALGAIEEDAAGRRHDPARAAASHAREERVLLLRVELDPLSQQR